MLQKAQNTLNRYQNDSYVNPLRLPLQGAAFYSGLAVSRKKAQESAKSLDGR